MLIPFSGYNPAGISPVLYIVGNRQLVGPPPKYRTIDVKGITIMLKKISVALCGLAMIAGSLSAQAEGDKAKAEDSVLGSLEVAPGYKPAQKLLLEIEGTGHGP